MSAAAWAIVGLALFLVGVVGMVILFIRGVINWFYGPTPSAAVDTVLQELETEFTWTSQQEQAKQKYMASTYARTEGELRVASGRMVAQ